MFKTIPITIKSSYWISTALLSFLLTGGQIATVPLMMAIIFISVLFHELGHALTALLFGNHPKVELLFMGGLTHYEGKKLTFWKKFLIIFNGPFFGFILGVLAYYLYLKTAPQTFWNSTLMAVATINLFWSIINLFPVLPLDGGQLLRLAMEKWLGVQGLRMSFLVGGVLSTLLGMFFFYLNNLLGGSLVFLFAFENFFNFYRTRHIKKTDELEELKEEFLKAEKLLEQGDKENAFQILEKIRSITKEGLLYDAASQSAALILEERGNDAEAYQILKPLVDHLDPPALALLHRLAFDAEDMNLVFQIGSEVFQYFPTPDVALRNAYAAAQLNQVQATIGWLDSAKKQGIINLNEIVRDRFFDIVRENEEFQDWLQKS
jgi:Zn-dependent protease